MRETLINGAQSDGGGRATPARRSARRDQIAARAARMFQRHGYAATSMQQIADTVGLSKASLYYYVARRTICCS